jgi:hypothetical protein
MGSDDERPQRCGVGPVGLAVRAVPLRTPPDGDRKMLIEIGADPAERVSDFVARLRCVHCGRTNPEAFLASEKDAKDWSKRP